MENNKAALFWSGGKDSAFALWQIKQEKQLDIKYLITTVNRNFNRVSMHGLREDVIERQVNETGYPLMKMLVEGGSNKDYENSLSLIIERLKIEGINKVIYGDIFLEDLREYRDDFLKKHQMEGIYPLWKQDTTVLFQNMKKAGFRTVICCVSSNVLNEGYAGEELTTQLISTMPKTVDTCGENGEFHTFCFAGPVFQNSIEFKLGEKVFKPLQIKSEESQIQAGFWFIDIV